VSLPGTSKAQRLQASLDAEPLDVRNGVEMANEQGGERLPSIER
jgi:hypothetical protein